MTDSALLSFYRGLGPDHAGRRFDDILAWDRRRLEMVHDYIQWLFPLPEPSRFNPEAPLLTADDIAIFRTDAAVRAQVLPALDLMLDFLGLRRMGSKIIRSESFSTRSVTWLEPTNHNYLRLTRILLFLGHAGFTDMQAALLVCLENIALHEGRDVITPRTLSFWRDGAKSSR